MNKADAYKWILVLDKELRERLHEPLLTWSKLPGNQNYNQYVGAINYALQFDSAPLAKLCVDSSPYLASMKDRWTPVRVRVTEHVTVDKEVAVVTEIPPAVVVIGNPIDGITIYGPFDDNEAAGAWAENNDSGDAWWITSLDVPL